MTAWYVLRLVAALALSAAGVATAQPQGGSQPQVQGPQSQALSDSAFARLITRVSEPGGFFDSDNLISNETGYLYPIPRMKAMGVQGGVYAGVGPDQNYSYIAAIRPRIAFMIDIRRDAALQHLLYKALITRSRNRMEFLCLLFGKPLPAGSERWNPATLVEILRVIDGIPSRNATFDSTVLLVRRQLSSMSHPVSGDELATVARMHSEFFRAGLDLQFTSLGRRQSRDYPTFRSLLTAVDVNGAQSGWMSTEETFQVVRGMHLRNQIVPVTGDLAGRRALREIGKYARENGMTVSALYVSNVEFYLMRGGTFRLFAENVATLPLDARSVIIRSVFSGVTGVGLSRDAPPNAFSEQLLQTSESFVRAFQAGEYGSYQDLVTRHRIRLGGVGSR